jgi:hypothetical protein
MTTSAKAMPLIGLKHLRRLSVNDTDVTDAGKKALKEALPGLSIFR